ncbi:alanine racemase [Allonocardiopsis opalescens]|uniref:Alanine racemase n=1 Tax=Allonocardiopsis opalescens TaxID=1144618 RepID=A0A2T0Q8F3_9ACTN|nr:alanine racemase [Allonocardiopsis opalescens]PRY00024.1 alanine racemase [Allonocardiopsis opalescens]
MANQATARVELSAISGNVAYLAGLTTARVMVAVKADGYGHGIVPSARAALAGGAAALGTATVAEALRLRAAGITAPVLAWLIPPDEPLGAALAAGIELGVGSTEVLDAVVHAAATAGVRARVHLKADTGMHRGGSTPADWPRLTEAAAAAQAAGRIEVAGVFSHFACADEPGHPSIQLQLTAFKGALDAAESAGLRPELRHFANSAATLTLPESHYDLVRVGIAAYGLSPIPDRFADRLRPAMTFTAPVVQVKRVPPGSGVSYGHRYTTGAATTLALVPAGYADGVPRGLTNRGEVLAAGRRRRIAGTVCMDQFVVDVGDAEVRPGDEVVLFGPGDRGEPTAHDWAGVLGTISYEIVTRIGIRVPREYEDG